MLRRAHCLPGDNDSGVQNIFSSLANLAIPLDSTYSHVETIPSLSGLQKWYFAELGLK